MHLEFHAQEVHYGEALDGEMINVSFREHSDPEVDYSKKNFKFPPPVKGVFFSASYEFPPYATKVDWCDGEHEDGGEAMKEIELTKNSLKMVLKNNYSFNVSFETDDITFQNIKSFLIK